MTETVATLRLSSPATLRLLLTDTFGSPGFSWVEGIRFFDESNEPCAPSGFQTQVSEEAQGPSLFHFRATGPLRIDFPALRSHGALASTTVFLELGHTTELTLGPEHVR